MRASTDSAPPARRARRLGDLLASRRAAILAPLVGVIVTLPYHWVTWSDTYAEWVAMLVDVRSGIGSEVADALSRATIPR